MRTVDVQKAAGIDYRTLAAYETSRADIPLTRLKRLVAVYDGDLYWVLSGEFSPRSQNINEIQECLERLKQLIADAAPQPDPVLLTRIRLTHAEEEARRDGDEFVGSDEFDG